MNAEIFDIQRASYVDGPGIRTVVFFKGCNLRCRWCHNPESQRSRPELMFYSERCIHCGNCVRVCKHPDACIACGNCAEVCPSGARKLCGVCMSTDDIMKTIRRDRSYYLTSGGGATFSGGECLLQPEPLLELLEKCREDEIQTAVDTAGNVEIELIKKVSSAADLILYDVKHMNDHFHRLGTGAGNRQILFNLTWILDHCPEKVILRMPVIPGYNDSQENAEALRDFISAHHHPRNIELLPYHRLGESKYAALGLKCTAYEVPDQNTMERLKKIIGGK